MTVLVIFIWLLENTTAKYDGLDENGPVSSGWRWRSCLGRIRRCGGVGGGVSLGVALKCQKPVPFSVVPPLLPPSSFSQRSSQGVKSQGVN